MSTLYFEARPSRGQQYTQATTNTHSHTHTRQNSLCTSHAGTQTPFCTSLSLLLSLTSPPHSPTHIHKAVRVYSADEHTFI